MSQGTSEKTREKTGDESGDLSDIKSGKQPATDDVQLDLNADYDLQQRHVIKVMLEADRPLFSPYQIKNRLKSDPSTQTVRRRLRELVELDIVGVDEYRNHKLYHINDKRSKWAVPGDLNKDTRKEDMSLRKLVTFRAPDDLRLIVSHSALIALYLISLSVIFGWMGVEAPVSSSSNFTTAGLLVMISTYPLLVIQYIVDKVRG
ncbi:hypothetical protein ACOZ4F_07070 [Haloarcula marismortui]|uniref:hypothetical protein n=1 Tax=Haloarcula marismortui TaxID=2238 RepID=UPI003C70D77F